MSNFTPDSFAQAVLRKLHAPTTSENMKAMRAWMAQEGGNWHNNARFNPLNTTQPAPGAGNTGSQGNIKVYRSPSQGIQATVETLENGRYGSIVSALRSGESAAAVVQAIQGSPWGTGKINTLSAASSKAPKDAPASTSTAPTFSASQTQATQQPSFKAAAIQALSSGSGKLPTVGSSGGKLAQAAYLYRTGQATTTVPGTYSSKITAGGTTVAASDNNTQGNFKITGANPNRLKPELLMFARKVSRVFGETLTGDSGATHSKYTVDGNVSEHYTGNATDIPATGTRLVHMGQAALIAAGMPRAQALKQHGGLYNVGNHQVIFNTHLGGDHTNHLHISTHAAR